MLLCTDAAAASADLAAGLLGSKSARVRPDRARCRSCRRTHIVLPSWCAPRHADGIEVIGTAAAAGSASEF